MPSEGGQFRSPLQIPQFQGVIIGCRDGPEPVGGGKRSYAQRAYRYCIYHATMPGEGGQFPPGLQIPKFQGFIIRCGNGSFPVRGDHYCIYHATMPGEGGQFPPGLQIPQFQGFIF